MNFFMNVPSCSFTKRRKSITMLLEAFLAMTAALCLTALPSPVGAAPPVASPFDEAVSSPVASPVDPVVKPPIQPPVIAPVYSPIQSPARPFGLSIVDLVQVAGSDKRSAEFQSQALPTMRTWSALDLASPSFTQLTSTISIDPSRLGLATAYDTRAYFVGDNTSKHNSLGFNTTGGGATKGDPELIFPDASEAATYVKTKPSNTKVLTRTSANPLLPGDFVSLGTLQAGTSLDFFLISERTKKVTDVFSTETSLNPDGLQHALVFARADSPYLFIGFEDVYGSKGAGTKKDVLFAVDIGLANANALINMPEPPMYAILCSFLVFVIFRKRSFMQDHVHIRE
jgi:hypothetical protein